MENLSKLFAPDSRDRFVVGAVEGNPAAIDSASPS